MAEPKQLGYRMPAEWEPHEGTWLSWPHNPRTWVGNFGPIPSTFVEIVRGLCADEKVHICVRNPAAEQGVRDLLKSAKCDGSNVDFLFIPTNDAWARDHGPIFVVADCGLRNADCSAASAPAGAEVSPLNAKRLSERQAPGASNNPQSAFRNPQSPIAVIDWKFNSWGGKYPPWEDDDAVPERVAEQLGLPCFHPRMVLEGGSIDVNGKGTVLTTESVLLNPNRNPTMSKKQIEARLDEYLACRHTIWLGDGIVGDDTDGHIDDISRFVNATTVLTVVEDDKDDVNYKALNENFERLQGAKDQDGAKLEIVKLPSPGKVCRGAIHGGRPAEERLPASYANFYIGNAAVLVPVFGTDRDKSALKIIGDFFPGRKIIGINCKDLVGGYGAIHCVTQQQPKAQ